MGAGMALFFVGMDRPGRAATNPLAGDLIALLSALSWGLTILGSRWISRGPGGDGAVTASAALGHLLAFAICAPLSPGFSGVGVSQALILIYLGVLQLALANVLMSKALPHVPALEVSILLLVEPVVSPIWAFLLVREVPGVWSLVGGGVILVATVWNTRIGHQAVAPAD